MSKYNTIYNFLFNNTTPVLLPVPRPNGNLILVMHESIPGVTIPPPGNTPGHLI